LQQCVQRSVISGELREELSAVGKTAADVLIERGQQEGLQEGDVSLERTYMAAWQGVPKRWRSIIEGGN
jgi:hypothetical protein